MKPSWSIFDCRQLISLRLPLTTGKRWLGSFTTTFRYNEVIHYWALEGGWECFANHYPSWKESPPAEIVTWMSVAPALRDGWEDRFCRRYRRWRMWLPSSVCPDNVRIDGCAGFGWRVWPAWSIAPRVRTVARIALACSH